MDDKFEDICVIISADIKTYNQRINLAVNKKTEKQRF